MTDEISYYKTDAVIVFVAQALAAVGALVGIRLLTQFVSPEIFGEYKLILSSISLVVGVCVRPFIQFAMRQYHEYLSKIEQNSFLIEIRKLFNKYLYLLLFFVGVFYLLGFSNLYNEKIVILCGLIVLLITVKINFESALFISKNEQFAAGLILVSLKWLIPVSIILMVLVFRESPFSLMAGTLIGYLTIWILILACANSEPDDYEKPNIIKSELIARGFEYGWPIAIFGILSWILNESDRFFLLNYHDSKEVGLYSAAYGLVSAPFVLAAGAVGQFLFPIFFKTNRDKDRTKKMVSKSLLLNTLVVICGVLLIYIFADLIAFIGLDITYRESASGLFVWIAVGYGFFAMSSSFDLAAYTHKKTVDITIAYLIASACNIGLNILLIPQHASEGAAIATMLSLATYFFCMAAIYYYRQFFRHRLRDAYK